MGMIIVGVDESADAADALRWAVREGRLREWDVTGVLAWGYLDQHSADPTPFSPEYSEQDAAAALHMLIERACPEADPPIGERVINDLPARALIEASADADLVVVGARGLGGFRGLLLGSVSQQVVHHSKAPVAIVRGVENTGRVNRVVVGIDGSDGSRKALDWALDEARARHASIAVVSAWHPVVMTGFEYAAPLMDYRELRDGAEQVIDEAIADADTSGLPAPVEKIVVDGNAAGAILEAAAEASIVVVGSRGRGGFRGLLLGSVSQHIAHHATCPVVIVPRLDDD